MSQARVGSFSKYFFFFFEGECGEGEREREKSLSVESDVGLDLMTLKS